MADFNEIVRGIIDSYTTGSELSLRKQSMKNRNQMDAMEISRMPQRYAMEDQQWKMTQQKHNMLVQKYGFEKTMGMYNLGMQLLSNSPTISHYVKSVGTMNGRGLIDDDIANIALGIIPEDINQEDLTNPDSMSILKERMVPTLQKLQAETERNRAAAYKRQGVPDEIQIAEFMNDPKTSPEAKRQLMQWMEARKGSGSYAPSDVQKNIDLLDKYAPGTEKGDALRDLLGYKAGRRDVRTQLTPSDDIRLYDQYQLDRDSERIDAEMKYDEYKKMRGFGMEPQDQSSSNQYDLSNYTVEGIIGELEASNLTPEEFEIASSNAAKLLWEKDPAKAELFEKKIIESRNRMFDSERPTPMQMPSAPSSRPSPEAATGGLTPGQRRMAELEKTNPSPTVTEPRIWTREYIDKMKNQPKTEADLRAGENNMKYAQYIDKDMIDKLGRHWRWSPLEQRWIERKKDRQGNYR